MTVSTFLPTDYSAQTAAAYPSNIDSNFAVLVRKAGAFAPHAHAPANMTIVLDPGYVFDGGTLTELAAQTTATFTAPANNPRIDRAVIDRITGIAEIVAGDEAASPEAPAIPEGKLPVAQVLLQTTSNAITNNMITDERAINSLGLGSAAFKNTGITVIDPDTGKLEIAMPVSEETGASYTYDAADRGTLVRRSNSGSVMADTLPGTSPGVMAAGWVTTIANDDVSALMAIAAGEGAALNGAPLGYVVLGPNQRATIVSDGTNYNVVEAPARVRLAADTTLYVSTSGSDSNTGLTADEPFETIQKAVDVVADDFDLNGFLLTIQLADGTYTSGFIVSRPWVGGSIGGVVLNGNLSTPSNVIISASPETAVACAEGAGSGFIIQNLKLQANTGHCLLASHQAEVVFYNLVFGAAASHHIYSHDGSLIMALSNYSIVDGAARHVYCDTRSEFLCYNSVVTVTGSPNFSASFVRADTLAMIHFLSSSIPGTATGTRYYCAFNGVIFTNGGGVNYFPGNAAGSTATGGQYA
ncbi:MAG: hypothetical protein PHY92_01480 [Alphaproteobacteria bacterium]|nr:hypothetical protein [Alphaproteobacteria bacterium]